ncbi:Tudor protein [Nostoc linckia z18]|uniref:Tudor protein n=2 Tax=Nostoc linckia TaxID=92942 RepID=A0A9Q5ZBC1_NOSLI|nr:agenet domain-containing protein [Nostoc linckia]PHK41665.1 Tudor protein [Nostoc linckia z15]PHK47259.1 Tudor protein [Nostoc linckia z16]PHJ63075.1 Tudor protein [Nostoc linckia z1]PHJ72258.1 Tudor protein [Nostoc linckia z3]PHJ75698.1 Tudor protein [Nostoc linckia z2]
MDKSIIQLVDELPADNITVKVLKALDYVAPGEWNNLVGFDNNIRGITGETDPQIIQKIRDRAVSLYHDPQNGYQAAIKVYQIIDKADTAMATAALANKVGEKIGFLSFLSNVTPKADVTQSIDLALKIAVEIIAFCKLNGIPQPNPQQFANSLANNYQNASLMRMVALVCIDGILPLGPDFLGKIHSVISGVDTGVVAQNPVFLAVNNSLPGNTPSDKLGFINQSFNSVQGWMNGLVAKTGITPQSISSHLGNFIQIADDNLDFVAAFLDQTTNYYEHTGIQTVARSVILQAHTLVKEEIKQQPQKPIQDVSSAAKSSNNNQYALSSTVEVWDNDDEDWYQGTIEKVQNDQFYIHYLGYGSSYDEWVGEDDIRTRDLRSADDNGYAVGQKVKCWDDDQEAWYSATIQQVQGHQYFLRYIGYDSSYDEWVDSDEIR